MNFNPETSMKEAISKEKEFNEFFKSAKASVRNFELKTNPQKWTEEERELTTKLREAKDRIHHHLCNNIDTPSVIHELSSLVSDTNVYMRNTSIKIRSPLVVSISQYILRILKCLGVVKADSFGYNAGGSDEGVGETDVEKIITPFVQAAVDFRDQVKQLAGKDKMLLINECDKLRDDTLASLGIGIEDTGMTTPSIWVKEDPETLLKSIADKKAAKEQKLKEKEERKALEELKKNTPPEQWYKTFESDKYSQFDEEGVPTHNQKGEALKKEEINGLKKQMKSKQKKWQKQLEKEAKNKEKEDKKE